MSSLTSQRPLWVGNNQPRKRVDVVGMRKKVEMGETKAKISQCVRTACALLVHCVYIAHAEARIFTQEYLSAVY